MLLHSMRRVLSPLVVLLGLTVAIPSPSATTDGESLTGDALDRYCTAQLSSFEATYQSTQIATSRWTWYEGFGPTDSRGILTGSVTSQTYWTSTFYYTQYAIRAYTPKPPCCSSCYMTAGTIDFYFWPDQATPTAPASGQPSTSVDAQGFTFTSPSVYMAFSSLAANNKCGQVGDIWTSTTIAFDASEITTAQPITTLSVISSDIPEGTTTYHDILSVITTQPPPRTMDFNDIGQNCSTLAGYVYWPDNPMNAVNANYHFDPCHPIILLPPRLISMQPAWAKSSCGAAPGTSGAYDPPRVLEPMTTGTTLATPTPNFGGHLSRENDASPASSAEAGAISTTKPVTTGVSAISDVLDLSATVTASNRIATNDAGSATNIQSAGMGAAIVSGAGGSADSSAGSSGSKWDVTRVIVASAVSAASGSDSDHNSSASRGSSSRPTSEMTGGTATHSFSTDGSGGTVTPVAAASTSSGAATPATLIGDTTLWTPFLSLLLLLL